MCYKNTFPLPCLHLPSVWSHCPVTFIFEGWPWHFLVPLSMTGWFCHATAWTNVSALQLVTPAYRRVREGDCQCLTCDKHPLQPYLIDVHVWTFQQRASNPKWLVLHGRSHMSLCPAHTWSHVRHWGRGIAVWTLLYLRKVHCHSITE